MTTRPSVLREEAERSSRFATVVGVVGVLLLLCGPVIAMEVGVWWLVSALGGVLLLAALLLRRRSRAAQGRLDRSLEIQRRQRTALEAQLQARQLTFLR